MASFNKVILIGNLTADPELKQTQNGISVTSFSLAVSRRYSSKSTENAPQADFINIVAFGRDGEFAEKYLRKGMRILVEGRIQTGSYTNKEGQKVYTTDIVVERHEFVESKNSSQASGGDSFIPASSGAGQDQGDAGDGFMNIPDGIDEELPFN